MQRQTKYQQGRDLRQKPYTLLHVRIDAQPVLLRDEGEADALRSLDADVTVYAKPCDGASPEFFGLAGVVNKAVVRSGKQSS